MRSSLLMSLDQTGALVRAPDSSQSTRPGTQAEALARAVAESMPGGVLVVDAAGVIALANRQIELQFGYSCDELVGQSIDILLPESSRAAHAAHRASVMATPGARPMGAGRELLCRRRDGSEFPAEVGLSPLTTEDGTFVLAVVIETRDTSNRSDKPVDCRGTTRVRAARRRAVCELHQPAGRPRR